MNQTGDFIEMPFILGIVFLTTGIILYFFPPKNINSFYGYRTSKSMKNKETWTFAQKFSSVKAIQSSLFLFLISSFGFLKEISDSNNKIVGFVALSIVIVYMFFTTEKALKTKFPNS